MVFKFINLSTILTSTNDFYTKEYRNNIKLYMYPFIPVCMKGVYQPLLKSMSKVVARIARSAIIPTFYITFRFSHLESILVATK